MTNSELRTIASKNRAHLKKATTQINLALNQAIKANLDLQRDVQVRLLIITWMSWAETSLIYLAAKPIFTETETRDILAQRSEVVKWTHFLDLLFRKRFLQAKQKPLDRFNLGHKVFHQYYTLSANVKDTLGAFIEVRNRLAHGQWRICLDGELTKKNQVLTTRVWQLTKKDTLLLKINLEAIFLIFDRLTDNANDFDIVFDEQFKRIDQAQKNYGDGIEWLFTEMRSKHHRGKQIHRAAHKTFDVP